MFKTEPAPVMTAPTEQRRQGEGKLLGHDRELVLMDERYGTKGALQPHHFEWDSSLDYVGRLAAGICGFRT